MTILESQGASGESREWGGCLDECQIADMQQQLRELAFLHETSQVLTATLDLEEVLRSLMAQVRDYFQVEAASVALLDEETGELVFRVAVGKAAEEVIGLRLSLDQGIAGWVMRNGQSILVPAAHADDRFYSGIDDSTDFHTQAMFAIPVTTQDRTIGVIEAINPVTGTFDQDAQRILLAVADLASAAIRNADLYERVRQAERCYESLFSESADPIIVLDLEGWILDLNPRAVEAFEFPRERLSGAHFCDVLKISSQAGQQAIQQVRDGQRSSMEVKVPSREGLRILETSMVKIDYGGREAIQWRGHDISERVALEQMREDLTHMIVHDLRNPLGSIMSSLQLIHTAFVERDQTLPVVKLLGIAMRSGQKLYRLIDSLLDLGRLESGETELTKTLVNPQALVEEAIDQIQPLALNREQTLAMRVNPDLPWVLADGDLILRVLTNLLDNAVKFNSRSGHTIVSVECREGEILFSVADTGPGIPPEFRQRIFDRFSRLPNAEGVKGTGLGLAFCKLAVEAHGGRLWVESAWPGNEQQAEGKTRDTASRLGPGSTFYFTLPLEDR